MKIHVHELEDNIKLEIKNTETQVKDGDFIENAKTQDGELTAL